MRVVETETKPTGRKSSLPDPENLRKMAQTMTQQAIADLYGVTRQAVGHRLKVGTEHVSDKQHAKFSAAMPWPSVAVAHQRTYIYRQLRNLVKRQTNVRLDDAQNKQLDTFLGWLDDHQALVTYDKSTGWAFVPRSSRPGTDSDTYWT